MAHQVAADDGALAAVRRCGELVAEPGELRVAGPAAELDKAPRHAHQPLWAVLLLRATVPGGLGMLITTGPHRARRLSGICEAHSNKFLAEQAVWHFTLRYSNRYSRAVNAQLYNVNKCALWQALAGKVRPLFTPQLDLSW